MTDSPYTAAATYNSASQDTTPIVLIVGTDNVPRSHVQPEKIDTNLSAAEQDRDYPVSCGSNDSDGSDVTLNKDSGFTATSIEEVCKLPETKDEKEELSVSLTSKIVFEARNKCRDAIRLGSNEDGIEALENGLQTLRTVKIGSPDFRRLGEAEILLDLGRKGEAREALSPDGTVTPTRIRGKIPPTKRPAPSLRNSSSASDVQFEADMSKFNGDQHNQEFQEEFLKVTLRAEDWVKATKAAEKFHRIDPSFFNIKTKMDRYRKCRQLLILGGLEETRDPGADAGKALRLYNHGCFATELFHKHLDPPRAQVNGLDHIDSANLFFSAARVCVQFHRDGVRNAQGHSMSPKQFTNEFKDDPLPCSPQLTERDWMHQALHFMEQGRSRALLESIIKEDPEPLDTAIRMADVALAARETIRIEKKRKRDLGILEAQSLSASIDDTGDQEYNLLGLTGDDSAAQPSAQPTAIEELETPPQRKTRSLALGPLLDTTNLTDYGQAQVVLSPSSFDGSETGSATKDSVLAKATAQIRWQRVFLHALNMRNPGLSAALPTSTFASDASTICSKIPKDTAMIEYALVTAPPEGLISIVITSEGIQKCVWQKLDAVRIQHDIADLLSSVQSPSGSSRNASPTSPRKRAALNTELLLQSLRKTLLGPIQEGFAPKKKLIIIPSGELAHVPWTLLVDLPVAIVPSLSIWDHLNSHPRATKSPSKVSVVGNPPRNEDGTLRDKDIPWSYIEAFYVARIHEELPFLAGENNRKQFQDWVAMTRVLHLCAHGTFDNQDPASSGIQLFRDPLTIHDWGELAIKADLVVFSSCLSGISKAFQSGSAFGFAHALLGTGARAFIGSLWPVHDQATLLLMVIFYEELKRFSPAEALHNAQIRMRNLSFADIYEIVQRLEAGLDHEKVGRFVDRPKYWTRRLGRMRNEELQYLRTPQCWAAFVLTGYGFQNV